MENITERTKAPTQWTYLSGVTPEIEEEFHHMQWAHQHDGESEIRLVGRTRIMMMSQTMVTNSQILSAEKKKKNRIAYATVVNDTNCNPNQTPKHNTNLLSYWVIKFANRL